MVRDIKIGRYALACLFLLAGCSAVYAQNVVFSLAASATKIGLQDQMQVQYNIQDAGSLKRMVPEGLDKDFKIVGGPFQSQSSQITSSNGRTTQTVSFSITYIIMPKRTGTLTIPAGVAEDAEGHLFKSNTLNVQVVAGSTAPRQQPRQQQQYADPNDSDDPFVAMMQQRQRQLQALRQQQYQQQQQHSQQPQAPSAKEADINIGKDLFIRVTVDKSKVHVGEQITASYKLYARLPMNVSISKLPSLNGFWTQDFEMPKANIKPVEEVIDGKKYQVFVLKKSALFPQQTGTLELDPAEAEGVARVVQQVRQRNPFQSMFDDPSFQSAFGSLMMNDPFFNDDFFSSTAYRDVKVHLKSKPVKIEVTPLPEAGKPGQYGGAVGNFTVSGKVDKTDITTDDAITYKLVISGSGNLKLIETPALNLPNGLDTYDPQVVDTITGRSTTISGSKIITYAIMPQTPGDYEIPAIPFTYFNPQSGQYITLNTQPVKLHVSKGKNYKPGAIAKAGGISDIHDIDSKPLKEVTLNSRPYIYSVGYWSMYAMPGLAFLALAVWRRREDELSKDAVLLKKRRANKVAYKRLTTAQKLLADNKRKEFYDEISKAIWLYLSDKLNIPLSSLSRESAQEALSARKVSPELRRSTEMIVDECETALYAPGGGTQKMKEAYQQAVDVISNLEQSFKA